MLPMRRFIGMAAVACGALVLGGCSLFGGDSTDGRGAEAFTVSTDGGATFAPRTTVVGGKATIAATDILTVGRDPSNAKRLFVGTMENGIYVTDDGGQVWHPVTFPPQKVYGIVVDAGNPDVTYATGVYDGISKVYKTVDRGAKWTEVYTEPTKESVITSLAADPRAAQTLYAGTSGGVILRTQDGGATWRSVYDAGHPVTAMATDAQDPRTFYAVLHGHGLLISRDGGDTFTNLTDRLAASGQPATAATAVLVRSNAKVYSVVTDPAAGGTVYAGTDGAVLRSTDYGATWAPLSTIASADTLPVMVIAVNPRNPRQIVYAAARTLYRSAGDDAMSTWTPLQISSSRVPSAILYDAETDGTIYVGMRKE